MSSSNVHRLAVWAWAEWVRLGAQFWRLFLAIAADNFARIANFYWIGYFLKPHKKTTHTIRSFEIFTNVFSCYFFRNFLFRFALVCCCKRNHTFCLIYLTFILQALLRFFTHFLLKKN